MMNKNCWPEAEEVHLLMLATGTVLIRKLIYTQYVNNSSFDTQAVASTIFDQMILWTGWSIDQAKVFATESQNG